MTMIAGVYWHAAAEPRQGQLARFEDDLRRALPRARNVAEIRSPRAYAVQLDFGICPPEMAAEARSLDDAEHGGLLCCGDLFPDAVTSGAWRHEEVKWLQSHWQGDASSLRECTGSFALCHLGEGSRYLCLATDKLGVWPMYYWANDSVVVFATALKVLEACPMVPKVADVRALTEMAAFGFPLSDRTPYAAVKLLRSGEFLQAESGITRTGRYFAWSDVEPSSASREESLEALDAEFTRAVSRRARGRKSWLAFLSGGMDSRCVVSRLHQMGHDVTALTIDLGMPDVPLAGDFAKSLGIRQVMVPRRPEGVKGHHWLGDVLNRATALDADYRMIFSGDGGSCGLGHVYLTPQLVDLLRARKPDEVVKYVLKNKQLTRWPFHPRAHRRLAAMLHDQVLHEIGEINHDDPVRAYHVFLLENDQRRHNHALFEGIDECRVELCEPFYDGGILALITSLPVEWCLYHRFYTDWVAKFPPSYASVPWQTYPGHVPCPVPGGPEKTQWNMKRSPSFRTRSREARGCWRALESPARSSPLLRPNSIRLASIVHATGMRTLSAGTRTATLFCKYLNRCDGRTEG